MAENWVKMRVALIYDGRVERITQALCDSIEFRKELCGDGGDPGPMRIPMVRHLVVGALHNFWSRMQEITTTGRCPTLVPKDVDNMVALPGFSDALIAVGWLKEDKNGGLVVPNWKKHNGESAKKRAVEARKKRIQRDQQKKNGKKDRPDDVPEVSPENGDQRESKKESKKKKKKETTGPGPIRHPAHKSDPVEHGPCQTGADRAEPDRAGSDRAGSDRAGSGKGSNPFRQLLVLRLCEAFGLEGKAALRQKQSLNTVAGRIHTWPNRDEVANELITLAFEKRDAGMDRPVAAWQTEANLRYPPTAEELRRRA